jgi:transposase
MMTQEEYVNEVLALKRQGKTMTEIAEQLGYHPATISKWLRNGGPPPARSIDPAERVIDAGWAERIRQLVQPPAEKLLAESVFEIVSAEGFAGSYQTVVRHLREVRGPRFRAAPAVSVPIETAPGQEAQFDFSECSDWTERWGLGEVWCFGCILCWSRWRLWWFTSSVDREHTFEGLVRFFEAVGGMPKVGRTDRMGALGVSQGKRFRLHPPTIDFARHHGIEIKACQAGDAKRKGKSERPFRDLKESFLCELDALGPPASIGELNHKAGLWLPERVHARPHSTTGVAPAERLEVERRFLGVLPAAGSTPRTSRPAGSIRACRWWSGMRCLTRCPPDGSGTRCAAGSRWIATSWRSPPGRRWWPAIGSPPAPPKWCGIRLIGPPRRRSRSDGTGRPCTSWRPAPTTSLCRRAASNSATATTTSRGWTWAPATAGAAAPGRGHDHDRCRQPI